MRRRALLFGVSGLIATAGCVSRVAPWASPIANTQLTAYDSGEDFYDEAPAVTDPPRITFDPETPRVDIVGKLFVGSSSCEKAALADVTYTGDTDTLRVVIGSGDKPNDTNPCTGDESADAYHAQITFHSSLPQTVIASETGGPEERQTTAHKP